MTRARWLRLNSLEPSLCRWRSAAILRVDGYATDCDYTSPANSGRLHAEPGDPALDLSDALLRARKVAGLQPNP